MAVRRVVDAVSPPTACAPRTKPLDPGDPSLLPRGTLRQAPCLSWKPRAVGLVRHPLSFQMPILSHGGGSRARASLAARMACQNAKRERSFRHVHRNQPQRNNHLRCPRAPPAPHRHCQRAGPFHRRTAQSLDFHVRRSALQVGRGSRRLSRVQRGIARAASLLPHRAPDGRGCAVVRPFSGTSAVAAGTSGRPSLCPRAGTSGAQRRPCRRRRSRQTGQEPGPRRLLAAKEAIMNASSRVLVTMSAAPARRLRGGGDP